MSWCVLPGGYRCTAPPALLCLMLKSERNARFTGKEGERITAATTRISEKPSLQNWVCFPHWITGYTVLGRGTGAFSRRLLLAVGWRHTPFCPLHLQFILHPFPMLSWKKLVSIWSQGCFGSSLKVSHVLASALGTRTLTKHRHREGGRWQVEFSTDHT